MSKINDEGFLEISGIHQVAKDAQLSIEAFPVLKGLTPLSLRVLNQDSHAMNVAKGVEMVHAGDTPHDLYFIAKGSISVAKQHNGKIQVVAKLKAGDFYGEYGALRGKTRFASVYTAEPSVIIRVDLNAIQQVIDTDESFKDRIYTTMRARLLSSFLFGHPAFEHISVSTREVLSKQLKIVEVGRNEVLFEAGDKAENYYIVLSGEAEIYTGKAEKEVMLEIRRDNDTLGEARVKSGSRYAYTVRAANQLDLLCLDQAAMQMVKSQDDAIVNNLNKMMAVQVKKTITAIQQANG
ncbi:MAG: cyclic nucleotide-binding domain-containing protein [Ghiorsea sp.]